MPMVEGGGVDGQLERLVGSKNEDHFVSKIEVADHESEVKKFLTPILSFAGI